MEYSIEQLKKDKQDLELSISRQVNEFNDKYKVDGITIDVEKLRGVNQNHYVVYIGTTM